MQGESDRPSQDGEREKGPSQGYVGHDRRRRFGDAVSCGYRRELLGCLARPTKKQSNSNSERNTKPAGAGLWNAHAHGPNCERIYPP